MVEAAPNRRRAIDAFNIRRPLVDGGLLNLAELMDRRAAAIRQESLEGEASVEITSSRYQDDIFEVKNIGSGSFGCAILVEARSTGERFVAKKITFEHLTPEEQLKAQNEAALLKSFSHVNITEYLGSFVIGNVLHIIMEYCSGGSLQQAMARRERANETFDEEEVFDWFLQAHASHIFFFAPSLRAHVACIPPPPCARAVARRPPTRAPRPPHLALADWHGARVCPRQARAAPRHQDVQCLPNEAQPRQVG